MSKRVVIVTGASSGIGYQVAQDLCGAGNDVILACRNEEKTMAAINKIIQVHPNALATYIHLDLSSLESVRAFVREFEATGKSLNVLINNAAICMTTHRSVCYSADNLELTIATNYVGHFLLTHLLLEAMKKTAAENDLVGRIINITSMLHHNKSSPVFSMLRTAQPLDIDNMFLCKDGTYDGLQAYKNSKLAQIMFTYELSRKLENTGVTVNAVTPGVIVPDTELMRHEEASSVNLFRLMIDKALKFFKFTPKIQEVSSAICDVATHERFKEVTGRFLEGTKERTSSEESLNEELQKKLWDLTARYVHLEGYEPLTAPPPPAPVIPDTSSQAPTEPGDSSKKNKDKSGPGSAKKSKKRFSLGIFKKEEVSVVTGSGRDEEKDEKVKDREEKVNGKEEKVKDNKVRETLDTTAEIHYGFKEIDLSTDVEEKLGKGDEGPAGENIHNGKQEEKVDHHSEKNGDTTKEAINEKHNHEAQDVDEKIEANGSITQEDESLKNSHEEVKENIIEQNKDKSEEKSEVTEEKGQNCADRDEVEKEGRVEDTDGNMQRAEEKTDEKLANGHNNGGESSNGTGERIEGDTDNHKDPETGETEDKEENSSESQESSELVKDARNSQQSPGKKGDHKEPSREMENGELDKVNTNETKLTE